MGVQSPLKAGMPLVETLAFFSFGLCSRCLNGVWAPGCCHGSESGSGFLSRGVSGGILNWEGSSFELSAMSIAVGGRLLSFHAKIDRFSTMSGYPGVRRIAWFAGRDRLSLCGAQGSGLFSCRNCPCFQRWETQRRRVNSGPKMPEEEVQMLPGEGEASRERQREARGESHQYQPIVSQPASITRRSPVSSASLSATFAIVLGPIAREAVSSSDLRFRGRAFRPWGFGISSLGLQALTFGFGVSSLGLRALTFGFWVSSLGLWASAFGHEAGKSGGFGIAVSLFRGRGLRPDLTSC